MSLAGRVRLAFTLLLLLLAAVVGYHLTVIRAVASRASQVSAATARLRGPVGALAQRAAAMRRLALAHLATGSRDSLARLRDIAAAFDADLARVAATSLTAEERLGLTRLAEHWRAVEPALRGTGIGVDVPAVIPGESVRWTVQALDQLHTEAVRVAGLATLAITRELAAAERDAAAAHRVGWMSAVVALLLGLLVSLWLARELTRPLERLAQATRELAGGRFDVRVAASSAVETDRVAREFNAMAVKLGELDQLKRDVVSNVSHDLKSPVSALREVNDALLDGVAGPLNAEQRRLLELNRETGKRLAGMIAKFLDLARLDAGHAAPKRAVDLAELAREAVGRMNSHGAAAASGIALHVEATPTPALVAGDADELALVLDNLLENAAKFSPAGGTVRVEVREEPATGLVLATISDEGPGIPMADRERVFERFQQAAAGRVATARARGVGLGLAICHGVIAGHGGSIRITDNAPRGTVVHVELPRLGGAGVRASPVTIAA